MGWELNIRKSKDGEKLLPMGSYSEVQAKIGEIFPGVEWLRNGSGNAELDDGGVIEFDLQDAPVEVVFVTVRGADPTNQFLQLAKSTGWYVEDMSTGQRLKRTPASTKPSKRSPPRTQTWEELSRTSDLTRLHLIELQSRETSTKVYNRYSDWEDQQALPQGFRSFILGYTSFTVKVPGVGHMCSFHYQPRASEKSTELVETYCAQTGRIHGRIQDDQIVLSNGTSIPCEQAEIHRR
ncbi:MAG: hypothetical protein KDA69_08325 [Planctomycetaceae bacterium]|nr:hypothetical protein [Planctomycetaceae bacterium]MCA9044311.1 hypothetical protein [Planctomycetaceae bacterium]